ncbi:hypothetical protein GGI22_005956, partial [Coemansia erecta]
MNKELNALAVQNNVHIASLCGFDSIPADLGCKMLADYAKEKYGKPLLHVKGSLVEFRGGASGGTLASVALGVTEMVKSKIGNLFKESNKDSPPDTIDITPSKPFNRNTIHYDRTLQRWQTFWLMSEINVMTAGWAGSVLGYGPGFTYAESLSAKSLIHAVALPFGLFCSILLLTFSFTRNILYATKAIPRPGEGPSEERTKSGFFSLHLEAFTESETFYGMVSGDSDPGYGETIKYLGESALCLAFDKDDSFRPGVYPPSVIMGDALLSRLRSKGCHFEISEIPIPSKVASPVIN